MLTINADDLGRNPLATERIVECYDANRVTSASGMVFMAESSRAAVLACERKMDVGLHLNLSEPLTGKVVPDWVRRSHERIRNFLCLSKYALLIYNPFLRKTFRDLFRAQWDEFTRLYGREPLRVDGHQHLHLCTNMLMDNIIPRGMKVRRSFSFQSGEKSLINRQYRKAVDRRLSARYIVGDNFFALSQQSSASRLGRIVTLSQRSNVELMTHPEVNAEYEFLVSQRYFEAISRLNSGVCASN